MSSFICSAKHFNSIELGLLKLTKEDNFYFPYTLKAAFPQLYSKMDYPTKDIQKAIKNVVDELRKINAICVCLQYKHHYEGTLDAEIQESTTQLMTNKDNGKPLNKIELYKALNCLNYQIEIDHLKDIRDLSGDEAKAMLFLDEIIPTLADDIVHGLDSYDKAAWEIN